MDNFSFRHCPLSIVICPLNCFRVINHRLALAERDVCLLPARAACLLTASTLHFPVVVDRANRRNLDVEDLLDSALDLGLRRLRINTKGQYLTRLTVAVF